MSKPSSERVFQLIKALTRAEKRYFKVYVSKQATDESNNLRLFDVIDEQLEFSEEALRYTLRKDKGLVNSLSTAKVRLYDAILRSLDSFHSNSSIDAQLKRTLHCVEILYKKTLYSHSMKLLEEAKKLAYEYDKHTTLLEIFMWEKMLIEKDNYETVGDAELEAMMEENRRITRLIEVYNDYWGVKSRLFNILNKSGKARSDEALQHLKDIIDRTLTARPKEHLFHQSEYLYNHIYSAYYFGVGDYAASYGFLKNNVTLIEQNLDKFQEEPNVYFSVLTNIVYIGSQLKRYDEVFDYLNRLRRLPERIDIRNNEDLQIKLFSSSYSIELTIYFLTGDFEAGLTIIPQVENGIMLYGHKLNSVRKAFFFYNVAIIYFGAERYNDSLKWVNRLLNDIDLSKSEDIYCFGQILNLLIHIELNTQSLLPYSLRNTQRFLSTRNRFFKFESTFLDFTTKFLKKAAGDHRELYAALYQSLLPLRDDRLEKTAFEYFDFLSWAEAKSTGRRFAEVVKERSTLPDSGSQS